MPSDPSFTDDREYLLLEFRMVHELEVIDKAFPLRKQIDKWSQVLFLSFPGCWKFQTCVCKAFTLLLLKHFASGISKVLKFLWLYMQICMHSGSAKKTSIQPACWQKPGADCAVTFHWNFFIFSWGSIQLSSISHHPLTWQGASELFLSLAFLRLYLCSCLRKKQQPYLSWLSGTAGSPVFSRTAFSFSTSSLSR